MAKNLIQKGDVLDLIAPTGGVVSGAPVLIGSILVVPLVTAAETEVFAGQVVGVFEVAKATGVIAAGAKVYWNATNSNLTTTASGNTLVGVAVEAAASGDATVKVRLDGVAR